MRIVRSRLNPETWPIVCIIAFPGCGAGTLSGPPGGAWELKALPTRAAGNGALRFRFLGNYAFFAGAAVFAAGLASSVAFAAAAAFAGSLLANAPSCEGGIVSGPVWNSRYSMPMAARPIQLRARRFSVIVFSTL